MPLMQLTQPLCWLILLAILLAIEVITLGLTTIWFAGGALAALGASMLGANVWIQIGIFVVVSVVLLIFTRPIAVKYLNGKREKTNYEGIIGKLVKVTETIDNYNQKGKAVVGGQEWTARAENDNEVFEAGELVKVVNIAGVKLIVKRYEEEKEL